MIKLIHRKLAQKLKMCRIIVVIPSVQNSMLVNRNYNLMNTNFHVIENVCYIYPNYLDRPQQTVNPDQTLLIAVSDQGLHCLKLTK